MTQQTAESWNLSSRRQKLVNYQVVDREEYDKADDRNTYTLPNRRPKGLLRFLNYPADDRIEMFVNYPEDDRI